MIAELPPSARPPKEKHTIESECSVMQVMIALKMAVKRCDELTVIGKRPPIEVCLWSGRKRIIDDRT